MLSSPLSSFLFISFTNLSIASVYRLEYQKNHGRPSHIVGNWLRWSWIEFSCFLVIQTLRGQTRPLFLLFYVIDNLSRTCSGDDVNSLTRAHGNKDYGLRRVGEKIKECRCPVDRWNDVAVITRGNWQHSTTRRYFDEALSRRLSYTTLQQTSASHPPTHHFVLHAYSYLPQIWRTGIYFNVRTSNFLTTYIIIIKYAVRLSAFTHYA